MMGQLYCCGCAEDLEAVAVGGKGVIGQRRGARVHRKFQFAQHVHGVAQLMWYVGPEKGDPTGDQVEGGDIAHGQCHTQEAKGVSSSVRLADRVGQHHQQVNVGIVHAASAHGATHSG